MGRMLDTLKKGESQRGQVPARNTTPAVPVQDCVVDWTLGDQSVPYVEVGSPDRKIEFSPNLLHKHPNKVQPPHAAAMAPTPYVKGTPTSVSAPAPMATKSATIVFEPWPGTTIAPLTVATDVIAYHQPDHAISKEYAQLLDQMLLSIPGMQSKALMLLGSENASTVLLNLAALASHAGKRRVILLDLNAMQPSLASRMGQTVMGSLQEVLAGRVALEQAILKTAIPTLMLLSCAASTKPLALNAESAGWLIRWLRDRSDLVLIDATGSRDIEMLSALAPTCDGLYVARKHSEKSSPSQFHALSQLGGKLRGMIHVS